ncbi:eukaryotic translation initiation factor 4B2-like [Rhagoletis pomonella]|uniref:eukaryotic translation initiation factor 4B2-like n=1 Tax=Rhagoletis pomonella TaxID=28610 RepID=UPI00177CCE95|nr:eukaryotic translation initiation factor 4B2-like [Rhagoletis pomonella]XP_036347669.1 eukaryotic translation initiation factor 4B2-like [Rhagoletis pomonella]XP_036347670.1 eukaryotic translation initiation factor 4B2-like [Rhagoletis pomonella]XP_036347671.1 eukaryotic translation initiation factor 4B2-like [Rhagoletis pomonella]
MGRCRGVPFEFPIILLRPLRPPRRAGGRTTKMNTNTYLNNTYKSNERALADLLGQLVRGRNTSPTGFNRGGVGGGSGVSGGGGGGPMSNYGSSSMGPSSGGGGGGWGGNAPNDWNQGGGGGGGFGGGGGGGSGNIMPLMQRGGGMNMNNSGGGGGGYGGGGMNDNFGGMQQGNNFMSRGNQGGFGGMQPSRGMNNSGFGGGGYSQSDNFGGDGGFGGGPSPQGGRSRGTWVSGAANRSNRNAAPPRGSSRPSNSTPARRSLSDTKAPLSSRNNRSGGASASGNASRPVQAQKRRAPEPSPAPTKAKISANNARPTSVQGNKTGGAAAEPRRVLTPTGGRWYQHFLMKGLKPEEARKIAFENNNKPFTAGNEGAAKKNARSRPPRVENYVRVAIYAKGFPENMLDPEDLSSLEELIIDEVANSSAESKLQFERLLRKPGMLILDCLNQQTADWLTDIIPKLTNWENPELVICNEENIPDAYVMTISLPRSVGQDYDQTLALIQSQNDDLVTDSWEWVNEREDGDRLVVTIRIDKESHAAIKEKRWKIFYKFGVIDVNFARYVRFALSKRLTEEAAVTNNDGKEGETQAEDGEKETTAEAEEDHPPSPPPAPVISK